MEKITKITPAFDKRNPNPHKNYGVHGCELRMVLKGELGAMQFVLFTNWHLSHVREQFEKQGSFSILLPLPANVGYHSPVPMYEGQPEGTSCTYLDGKPCYYDGSGLYAETAFEVLKREGSDGLWEFLEKEYIERFGELR